MCGLPIHKEFQISAFATNIDKNRSILFMMAEKGEQHFNQTRLLKAEHSTWCEIQRGVRSVRRQAKLLQVAVKAH